MRIGLIGFGRMGAAMAARLTERGQALHVWSRSQPSRDAAAALGATLFSTPTDLVAGCDVVISSLFDEAAVRAVYVGAHGLCGAGLCGAGLAGRLLIETSTMPPGLGAELAKAVAAAGGRFVDAPVLGSVVAARKGALIAVAGGAAADIEAARPVLTMLAKAVHAMGAPGAGYAAKLAINLLKATYWATLGDCMALARRYGIDPAAILDIVESGPGASVELALKLPVLRGEPTEPAFDIIGCQKDLRAIVAAGGGAQAVPVAAGALSAVDRAVAGGWAHRDVAAVALFAASLIGPETVAATAA